MKSWFRSLEGCLGLFLESSCSLCQRITRGELCQDCERQVLQCQLPQPAHSWQGHPPVFAWGEYGGSLKRAIAALKYQNRPQLGRSFGYWLGQAWLASQPGKTSIPLVVVPIPLHASKQNQRGYNQAELIGRYFCQITRLPLASQGLQRTRATTAQFGLSSQEREQNLTAAFQVGHGLLASRSILLVDDIYTTGATARAAMQAFHRAGFRVYGLVAVAQAIRQITGDTPGAEPESSQENQKLGRDSNH